MSRHPSAAAPSDVVLLRRVRRRLVAWSAGLTVLVLLGLGVTLYAVVNGSLTSAAIAALERRADAAVERLSALPPDRFPRRPNLQLPDIGIPFGAPAFGGTASGTVTLIVDRAGQLIGPLQPGLVGLPIAAGVRATTVAGEDLRETTVDGTPVRALSRRITVNGEPLVIQVVQDRAGEQRTLALLVTVLGGGAAVAVALAIGLGFVYAGRALGPIRTSLQRQREFAADASHELRTPLAVLRLNVSELRRETGRPIAEVASVIDDMGSEVTQLTTLVEELLLLARSDSGAIEIRRDPLDLANVVRDALPRLGDLAVSHAVTVSLDAHPAPTHGDSERLAQLVTILVDNAIRHSPADRTVTVTVGPGEGRSRLIVEDAGPGIRSEDLPRVFDRFWRAADAPPGGVGLGLAIAAWIAQQHNGQITAANGPSGGARFEVTLPIA